MLKTLIMNTLILCSRGKSAALDAARFHLLISDLIAAVRLFMAVFLSAFASYTCSQPEYSRSGGLEQTTRKHWFE